MIYEDYLKTILTFKGILKNYPEEVENLKVHFSLIMLKIKDFDEFKFCLLEHLKISDWFPTHIDLFKHLELFHKIKKEKEETKEEKLLRELKKLLIIQNDEFINNKNINLIDSLRFKLNDTEKKIKELEEIINSV